MAQLTTLEVKIIELEGLADDIYERYIDYQPMDYYKELEVFNDKMILLVPLVKNDIKKIYRLLKLNNSLDDVINDSASAEIDSRFIYIDNKLHSYFVKFIQSEFDKCKTNKELENKTSKIFNTFIANPYVYEEIKEEEDIDSIIEHTYEKTIYLNLLQVEKNRRYELSESVK